MRQGTRIEKEKIYDEAMSGIPIAAIAKRENRHRGTIRAWIDEIAGLRAGQKVKPPESSNGLTNTQVDIPAEASPADIIHTGDANGSSANY